MIKLQSLLDFLKTSEHKPSEALQAKIDSLPAAFTLQQMGETMLKDDDGAMSEGALLAMGFAQHLLEKGSAEPLASKPPKKAAQPTPLRPSGSVGCSRLDLIERGGFRVGEVACVARRF